MTTRLPAIDAPRSSMSYASSEHARAKAAIDYARARQAALLRAKQRYEARFELVEGFFLSVLQHCAWRISLRAALELPTAFSSTSTRNPYRAQKRAFVTAFSTAVILPEHMHIPLAALDDFAKRLYDAYDVDCSYDGIDYREPLMGLAHASTSLNVAVEVYLRAAYRAYDGDGNAGLTQAEVERVLHSMCASDAETHAISMLMELGMHSLFHDGAPAGDDRDGHSAVRPRVDIARLVRWSEAHADLRAKLQALRVARSHPTRQADHQLYLRTTAVVQKMFDLDSANPERLQAAKRHYELFHCRLVCTRMRLFVQQRLAWRERVQRLTRRRAVRKWHVRMLPARAWRAKLALAHTVWSAHAKALVMATWRTSHTVMRLHDAAQQQRAERYSIARAYDRVLRTWHDQTLVWRADGAFQRRALTRTWRAWAQYAHVSRHGRAEADAAAAAAAARVRDAMAKLEAEERARVDAELLKVEAQKQQAFLAAAAAEAAQVQWQLARAEAARRSADREKAAAQAAARRAAARDRRTAALSEFKQRWDARIAAAMAAARAAKLALLSSPAGLVELDAMRSRVLTAETMAAASQDQSDFVARVDTRDGCIHYTRVEAPGVPAMDFNIDNMSYVEAKHVALAHASAAAACAVRDALLDEKRTEEDSFLQIATVNMLIHALRSQRARARIILSLRERLELCMDPLTGAPYVYDADTGCTFAHPMRMCRKTTLFFMPDWYMRTAADGSVSYVRTASSGQQAQRPGSPRKAASILATEAAAPSERDSPPEEYIMCAACGVDFATRQCHGDECNSYPYCFACFASYHPRDHAEYATHWATWTRLYVRPGAQLAPDEAALLRGRTRRFSVLRLSTHGAQASLRIAAVAIPSTTSKRTLRV